VIRVEDPSIYGVPLAVRTVAVTNASIVVLGETGVGKEMLSSTVHKLSGRMGLFLPINCAALTESLFESELFGHEQGAFTGATRPKVGLLEAAHKGTVLLDEIGELPLALQAKLLRVIETRQVTRVGAVHAITIDVRFVAATHRDLASEVVAGRFRADLYYRLDGVSLEIPPLRERRGQIAALAAEFIAAAQADREPKSSPTAEFLELLEAHDWPGNVRELKATVERAVMLADGHDLNASHLILSKRVVPRRWSAFPQEQSSSSSSTPVELDPERAKIVDALTACAGNQTRAAAKLGISRRTLANKLIKYSIPRPNESH